jgi:hypothetical protein
VTQDLVRQILLEVAGTLAAGVDETGRERLRAAREIFEATCLVPDWPQFFTGYAYEHFLSKQSLSGQSPMQQSLMQQGPTTQGTVTA